MTIVRHNSIVDKQEAEALKELIFKRARERAEAMANEVQTSYTSGMQNDVMELARNSFNSTKNPFSIEIKPEEKKEVVSTENIGFPQRKAENTKPQIINKNKISTEEITEATVLSTMNDARNELNKKSSFMGALIFLNSQGSIVLMSGKTKGFEAIA